jgi:hypothetical protein
VAQRGTNPKMLSSIFHNAARFVWRSAGRDRSSSASAPCCSPPMDPSEYTAAYLNFIRLRRTRHERRVIQPGPGSAPAGLTGSMNWNQDAIKTKRADAAAAWRAASPPAPTFAPASLVPCYGRTARASSGRGRQPSACAAHSQNPGRGRSPHPKPAASPPPPSRALSVLSPDIVA